MESSIPPYIEALKKEITQFSEQYRERFSLSTIYFGGGTPSIVPVSLLRSIVSHVKDCFTMTETPEVSIEANPLGLNEAYFEEIAEIGINRISFGVQSVDEQELRILDRKHTQEDAIASVEYAKQAGITNINLDLMYGIPSQTMQSLERSIEFALSLEPKHLSIYGLILHDETTLGRKVNTGEITLPDDDLSADMYLWLMDTLPKRGFDQYEISNWAPSDNFQCTHNLQYWHNLDYLGVGAGAYSHVFNHRWHNFFGINEYINRMNNGYTQTSELFSPAAAEQDHLEIMDEIRETIMMGLRLTEEGIRYSAFKKRFKKEIYDLFPDQITRLKNLGLLEIKDISNEKMMRLTKRGRMLGNQVFMEFV